MNPKLRLQLISLSFVLSVFLLLARLFYWQVLASDELTKIALLQQQTTLEISARRGEILFSDGSFLVANQPAYFAYLVKNQAKLYPTDLAKKIAPHVYNSVTYSATPSSFLSTKDKELLIDKTEEILTDRLSDNNSNWIPIGKKLTQDQRSALESLNISQLAFQEEQTRLYPEASMSAHLLGFVGQNHEGKDLGYHGLEGFYQHELAGRAGIIRQEKDAFDQPIVIGEFLEQLKRDGRTLKLHLNKGVQYLVEKKLKKAIDQFGAKAGSVSIINPHTGAILAMASLPSYDPNEYSRYDNVLYKNPVVSDAFEPGSIFKVLVVAAGLDAGVIKKDTQCDICHEAYKIDKYTIKTWDDKYRADSNVTDILVHSDNVGMVFIGQKLGKGKFLDYFKNFGLTQKTGIDLQDEVVPQARPDRKWSYVDLATASFGQGFVTTNMQLLQAVSVIANGGELVEPHLVDKIIGGSRDITLPTKVKHRVISKDTAKIVTEMMVAAAKEGEAKWTAKQGYQIAGKTGTAQVVVEGKYDEGKTNASFVGFAPANDPKFVMLVTLKEPSTSQWASETAAPLWFSIALDLLNHFNVVPSN